MPELWRIEAAASPLKIRELGGGSPAWATGDVNFCSGTTIRQIVVSAAASGTVFYPLVYWQVTMDSEFWKNCNFVSCPNKGSYFCTMACVPNRFAAKTQFVSLTYPGMCNKGVIIKYGNVTVANTVQDTGPVTNAPYWFDGNIPTIAGCLSDALEDALGIANGCNPGPFPQSVTALWRFQQ